VRRGQVPHADSRLVCARFEVVTKTFSVPHLVACAMRVLALTSQSRLKGRLTDDNEIIGQFTFAGTTTLIWFLTGAAAAASSVTMASGGSTPSSCTEVRKIWSGFPWAKSRPDTSASK
jgi:hypothetical protein